MGARAFPKALALLLFTQLALAAGYTMQSRWGHASTFLPTPPALLIQGGRVDPKNSYSYGSAPTSPDSFLLPLSEPFPASAPPYTLLSPITPGPAQAWHCLATLGQDHRSGLWQVLSFGGDGGWDQARSNADDSAWIIEIDPASGWTNYTHQPRGWAGQPKRRIYHSCAAPIGGGTVFITGGRAIDGSRLYNQVYAFSPAAGTFSQLPSLPSPVAHHSSVLLTNGTLLVFGGVYPESNQLLPSDLVLALDTTKEGATWQTLTATGGSLPKPRLGASASLNHRGQILMFGGADVTHEHTYADGWLLDPSTLQWSLSVPGIGDGVFDQSVSSAGGKIIVYGGYGTDAPAPPNTQVIETGPQGSGSVDPTFSWSSASLVPTTPLNGIPAAATGTGLPESEDKTSIPAATATSSADPTAMDASSGITRTTIIIISVLVGVGCLIALLILVWCCYKKKNKNGAHAPYEEKGDGRRRLMDEEAVVGETTLPPLVVSDAPARKSMAFAALGAGLSRAASAMRKASNESDGYRSLSNEALPKRRSTKRQFGRGIRLVRNSGPPLSPVPLAVGPTTRRDMLFDEDSESSGMLPAPVPIKRTTLDASQGSSYNWKTTASSTLLPASVQTMSSPPRTQYHDLDTSPPAAVPWQRSSVPARGPIPPASTYMNERRGSYVSYVSTVDRGSYDSSSLTDELVPRQSADIGTHLRPQASDSTGLSLSTMPDLAVFPAALSRHPARTATAAPSASNPARSSVQSTGVVSTTASMQEVNDAVISSAQEARPSTAVSYYSPDKFHDGLAAYSSDSGMATGTGSPSSNQLSVRSIEDSPSTQAGSSLFHRLSNNMLGLSRRPSATPSLPIRDPAPPPSHWPLQSTTSVASSLDDTLTDPPRPNIESHPSVISLPSVRSMRDHVVVKCEASVASNEAVIETSASPRDSEEQLSRASSLATGSFVTANESIRPSIYQEEGDYSETGSLLREFDERLGLSHQASTSKPLPQKPLPKSPDSSDPFSDSNAFDVDFGPTFAVAESLESPVIKRSATPARTVSLRESLSSFSITPRATEVGSTPTHSPAIDTVAPPSPSPMPKRIPSVTVLTPAAARVESTTRGRTDPLPPLRRYVPPISPVVTPTPSPQRNDRTPRRPVREVVESINRRNASAQLDGSPSVKYETARRPSLVVANPDRKKYGII